MTTVASGAKAEYSNNIQVPRLFSIFFSFTFKISRFGKQYIQMYVFNLILVFNCNTVILLSVIIYNHQQGSIIKYIKCTKDLPSFQIALPNLCLSLGKWHSMELKPGEKRNIQQDIMDWNMYLPAQSQYSQPYFSNNLTN